MRARLTEVGVTPDSGVGAEPRRLQAISYEHTEAPVGHALTFAN